MDVFTSPGRIQSFYRDHALFNDFRSTDISPGRVTVSKLLGRGGFGSVYEGYLDSERVAVKEFHTTHKNPDALQKTIETECNISLIHPNIVRTIGSYSCTITGKVHLVMQYGGDKNLGQFLNGVDMIICVKVVTFISVQILKAVAFTHAQNLIHLDIKPQNILVDCNFVCRLTDFGCAQAAVNSAGNVLPTERALLTGTYAYKCPEMLRGLPPTFKADIYSFGVLLNQLVTQEPPYQGLHPHYVMFAVVSTGLRPSLGESTDCPIRTNVLRLVALCWSEKAADRPFAQELVDIFAHRWSDENRCIQRGMVVGDFILHRDHSKDFQYQIC